MWDARCNVRFPPNLKILRNCKSNDRKVWQILFIHHRKTTVKSTILNRTLTYLLTYLLNVTSDGLVFRVNYHLCSTLQSSCKTNKFQCNTSQVKSHLVHIRNCHCNHCEALTVRLDQNIKQSTDRLLTQLRVNVLK